MAWSGVSETVATTMDLTTDWLWIMDNRTKMTDCQRRGKKISIIESVKQLLELNILLKKSLSLVNCNNRAAPGYTCLRPKQSKCVRLCVEQHCDILAVMATGSGKTLVCMVIPVYDLLYCQHMKHHELLSSITLVISPLNAIITQHQKVFGEGSACILKQG